MIAQALEADQSAVGGASAACSHAKGSPADNMCPG